MNAENNNINLSAEAITAINALQHPAGTYTYYRDTLSRLFNFVLSQSDEIGMSDTEAIRTLRVLDAVRSDLAAIAGTAATRSDGDESPEDVAARVADTFDDFQDSNYREPDKLDEGEEALKDLNNTLDRVKEATYILIEAGEHAGRAGNGDAITTRTAAVHGHFAEAASIIGEMVRCYSIILQEGKKD